MHILAVEGAASNVFMVSRNHLESELLMRLQTSEKHLKTSANVCSRRFRYFWKLRCFKSSLRGDRPDVDVHRYTGPPLAHWM